MSGIPNLLQFHECPTRAIVNIVKEAFRLLRPGGMLALTDNSVYYNIMIIIFIFLFFVFYSAIL